MKHVHVSSPSTHIRIWSSEKSAIAAEQWLARYKRLYIGDDIVRRILNLRAHRDSETANAQFLRDQALWSRKGGFIESVSLDRVLGWMDTDNAIVAEAAPRRTNGTFEAVADCVFLLPSKGWVADWLTEAPVELYDPDLYDQILADGPMATALIDFLGVLPEWSGHNMAGSARYAGIQEIRLRNQALPAEERIRYVAGSTFTIQGLEILDAEQQKQYGSFIHLDDLQKDQITNRASHNAISLSHRSPAHPVGLWSYTLPITVDDRHYRFHMSWTVHVRHVEAEHSSVTLRNQA